MSENLSLTTNLKSFNSLDRLRLQLKRFPKIVDVSNIQVLLNAIEKNGFGFICGELPKKYAYKNPKTGKEYPFSRRVMYKATKDKENFKLTRIPGLHVATGYENYGQDFDPSFSFREIIKQGFHGGSTCNVYLPKEDWRVAIKKYGYLGNTFTEKIVTSSLTDSKGDSYRVILWTGFSDNYVPTSETDIRVNPYGQGTVRHCPTSRLQPIIVLAKGVDINQRLDYYNKFFEVNISQNSIQVLNSNFDKVSLL